MNPKIPPQKQKGHNCLPGIMLGDRIIENVGGTHESCKNDKRGACCALSAMRRYSELSGCGREQEARHSIYFVLGYYVAVFFLDIVDSAIDRQEKQGSHVGSLSVVRI